MDTIGRDARPTHPLRKLKSSKQTDIPFRIPLSAFRPFTKILQLYFQDSCLQCIQTAVDAQSFVTIFCSTPVSSHKFQLVCQTRVMGGNQPAITSAAEVL